MSSSVTNSKPTFSSPPRLSRRQFAAAASLALGAPLLAACPGFALAGSNHFDVIVLGAGLSGLAAALTLKRAGAEVLVLEARQRVGGRVFTYQHLADQPEVGAVEIGDSYTRVRALAQEFGLQIVPSHFPRGLTLHVNDVTMDVADWPDSQANRLQAHERGVPPGRLEGFYLSQDIPLADAGQWDAPESESLDVSVTEALRARNASQPAMDLINIAGTHNHSDRMSVLSRWRRLLAFRAETGVGRLVRGSGELPNAMAAELGSGALKLGAQAVHLQVRRNNVQVETANRDVFRAAKCVCTLPVPALRNLRVDAPLAAIQREAIHALEYTKVTTAMIDAEPFWEDDGLPANMWTDTPLERIFPRENRGTGEIVGLKVFVNGDGADVIDALDDEAFSAFAMDTIVKMRPAAKGRLRVRFRHSWGRDPFSGGAYAAWPPGGVAKYRAAFHEPVEGLYFAGEHMGIDAPGMEGAVRSGERAARLALTS